GVLRGKKVRTTVSRKAVSAGDRVNRQFVAERPDQLWVADFTYVSKWQGFVYVAFIIDVFAGCIVGWRVSSSMETTFVLDALEQALWARRPSGTIHHSDKGSQYVSLAYTQRLKKPNCWHQQGVQVTRMTTRWRRASMAFTKRR
ncbi:integrase, partial [Escherichia coli O121:H19 str. 2010C-4989]